MARSGVVGPGRLGEAGRGKVWRKGFPNKRFFGKMFCLKTFCSKTVFREKVLFCKGFLQVNGWPLHRNEWFCMEISGGFCFCFIVPIVRFGKQWLLMVGYITGLASSVSSTKIIKLCAADDLGDKVNFAAATVQPRNAIGGQAHQKFAAGRTSNIKQFD